MSEARPGPSCARSLVVDRLSFSYPGAAAPVVREASLAVGPGQALGILGPNGAGKSTLLGALVDCLEGRRSGQVHVVGDPSGPQVPSGALVGFASQDVALYPTLTVAENIEHVARLTLGWRAARRAVARALDEYLLAPLAARRAQALSGGQQRLAHLAASFVHRPPVRLLDEPTTSLDFQTRLTVIDLIRAWRAEGVTTLVTSHYPEDIEDLCTDLLLLREGRTHLLGPVAAFLAGRGRALRLVVEVDGAQRQRLLDVDAGDLAGVIGALEAEARACEGDARVVRLELAATTLRDVLLRDPALRGEFETPAGESG